MSTMRSSTTLLRCLRTQSRFPARVRVVPRTSPYPLSSLGKRTNVFDNFRRYQSSSSDTAPRPLTTSVPSQSTDDADAAQNAARRAEEPAYRITFTCKPCGERSSHSMSKHGYHKGTVLISCPSCKNRHVISDHLGIFMDEKSTLEDILSSKGAELTKGYVEGDMEFWEDGSVYKTGMDDQPPEASTKDIP